MIIDCIGKAIFLFTIYNIVTLLLFGIPESLSQTHYLFKERKETLKVLFPATIVMLVICLVPCWIEVSNGSNFQFLSFLSTVSLLFVGVAPTFKESELENKVHNVAAYICVGCALLWIILVTSFWYVIPIVFGLLSIPAILTKTLRGCYTYWIEVGVFVSTFLAIILHYLN